MLEKCKSTSRKPKYLGQYNISASIHKPTFKPTGSGGERVKGMKESCCCRPEEDKAEMNAFNKTQRYRASGGNTQRRYLYLCLTNIAVEGAGD